MLNVILLSDIMLNGILLSCIFLSVFMLSCIMLSCIVLSCIMLCCIMLSCIMLSCIVLSTILLIAIMQSDFMLGSIMLKVGTLSVTMLSVILAQCRGTKLYTKPTEKDPTIQWSAQMLKPRHWLFNQHIPNLCSKALFSGNNVLAALKFSQISQSVGPWQKFSIQAKICKQGRSLSEWCSTGRILFLQTQELSTNALAYFVEASMKKRKKF